jgi:hypothetical protein
MKETRIFEGTGWSEWSCNEGSEKTLRHRFHQQPEAVDSQDTESTRPPCLAMLEQEIGLEQAQKHAGGIRNYAYWDNSSFEF